MADSNIPVTDNKEPGLTSKVEDVPEGKHPLWQKSQLTGDGDELVLETEYSN